MKTITKNLRWLITLLTMIVSVGAWADVFELYSGPITEGDYIICCNTSTYKKALKAAVSSSKFSSSNVTISSDKISDPDALIIWHIAQKDGHWTIYNKAAGDANQGNGYAACPTYSKAELVTLGTYESSDPLLWDFSFNNGICTITNYGVSQGVYPAWNILSYNSNSFYCYSNSTAVNAKFSLYKRKLITTIPDLPTLKAFRDQVNSGIDYSGQTVTVTENISVPEWDTPIGIYGYEAHTITTNGVTITEYVEKESDSHPFKGTFNGNGKTITLGSGSTVKRGLFGYVKNATIKDLNLVANIKDEENNSHSTDGDQTTNIDATEDYSFGFGGISHMANSSSFSNCTVTGTIEFPSSNNVGGVVGRIQGSDPSSITSCNVNVTKVNGHRMTGGVVGGIFGDGAVTISDCSTAGQVQGNVCTGGIVGNSENTNANGITIEKCFNKAQVGNNNSFKGGIIAHCSKGTITSCYNEGTVTAGGNSTDISYSGGIVGRIENGTVSYCYNKGTVTSKKVAGGIVGHAGSITLESVYNTGTVTADDFSSNGSGSVFGHNEGTSNAAFFRINDDDNVEDLSSYGNVASCTALKDSEIKGWSLYGESSSANKKIGLGIASDGNSRKWVFVSQNYPLLYDVRGQVVSFEGHLCKHEGENATGSYFLSFSSDVLFSTGENTNAYWVQGNDGSIFFTKTVSENHQSVTKTILASHSTKVLYPSDFNNVHQLGYILEASNTPKLQYRTENEKNSLSNTPTYYEVYQDGNNVGIEGQDMSEEVIRKKNALYGIDVSTKKVKLIEENPGCSIYVFGYRDRTGNEAFDTAIFGKYSGSELAANKGYIAVDNSMLEQNGATGVKAFSIFMPVADPEAVLLGDVDVDGAVTVTDVVKMVNVVLNESADDVIMKHGDVNGDGDLDVADVVAIVNKVLGVENDVKSRKVNSVANGGDEASLELNDGVVDFLLSNSSAFCAFQFYMSAEDGLDCESIILSARAKGHTVSMNKLTDGRYKVMCYSGVNKSFEGSEGELFNILTSGASGKLTLEDLFFVTPGASKVKFGNMDIDVVPTGISSIEADENANTIFDLSGRRVQKVQKGVYIVNGKKVIL